MQIPRSKTAIAEDIVKQVEAAGRPLSLAIIEANVPGFAAREREFAWTYEVEGGLGKTDVIWDGMTKEGCDALRSVMKDGRVTMLHGNRLSHILEGRYPTSPDWFPIALAPAWAATIQIDGRLFAGGKAYNDAVEKRGRRELEPRRWRRLWRM